MQSGEAMTLDLTDGSGDVRVRLNRRNQPNLFKQMPQLQLVGEV